MDRGAWQATVHGVTKSCTRLSEPTALLLWKEGMKGRCPSGKGRVGHHISYNFLSLAPQIWAPPPLVLFHSSWPSPFSPVRSFGLKSSLPQPRRPLALEPEVFLVLQGGKALQEFSLFHIEGTVNTGH